MRDLNATLDQSTIEHLQCKLPLLGATLTSTDDANLRHYLSFYQLPQPNNSLALYAGRITVGENHIATMTWQPTNSIGTAIVVHGYMDHIGLFNHLIQDLLNRQFTVVCFDLPGHGLSTGRPGYILDYADYVSVLESVINISRKKFPGPLHGVGQSMGGAILLKCAALSGFAYLNGPSILHIPLCWLVSLACSFSLLSSLFLASSSTATAIFCILLKSSIYFPLLFLNQVT